jgi:hypothetical protein
LNTWTQELCAIEDALSEQQEAIYVFDEGEQGQPAYEFRKEAELLFVSVGRCPWRSWNLRRRFPGEFDRIELADLKPSTRKPP